MIRLTRKPDNRYLDDDVESLLFWSPERQESHEFVHLPYTEMVDVTTADCDEAMFEGLKQIEHVTTHLMTTTQRLLMESLIAFNRAFPGNIPSMEVVKQLSEFVGPRAPGAWLVDTVHMDGFSVGIIGNAHSFVLAGAAYSSLFNAIAKGYLQAQSDRAVTIGQSYGVLGVKVVEAPEEVYW